MSNDKKAYENSAKVIVEAEKHMEFSVCLHPTNAKEQREKFLTGEVREPLFTYSEVRNAVPEFPELNVETELDALYRDRIGHTKGVALLMQLVGQDEEFAQLSQVLFPVTEVGAAAQCPPSEENGSVNSEGILSAFSAAMSDCNAEGWSLEIVDNCSSRMFVNQWSKKVAVRRDANVTEEELAALVRHEIGVHVLRSANGERQQEPLLHVGTLRGRLVEEGVACFMENPNGHPRIFQRHLAICTALSHSFRETWQLLCDEGCTPEEAWAHTLRGKRGLQNGASHGAFTKDAIYAQGYEEICAYAKDGGDFAPLLSAPIHPAEIELLTEQANMEVFPIPDLLQ
jgi:hypothetical protein